MIELMLAVIAAAQVVRAAQALVRRRPIERPASPPRDRPPPVYLPPPYCGRAASFDGLTGPCARRAGHKTRCMLDAEIEHIAEGGGSATVVTVQETAPPPTDVDIAALGRHVDGCPASLLANGALTDAELAWVMRTRVMVEAMVSGEAFSDWGDARA